MLLQDHCEAVANASTREEFQVALVRFAQGLGFGFMGAAVVFDHPGSRPVFVTATNAPQSYLDIFESTGGCRGPVMQHCKRSGLPIAWDQSTYVRAGQGEKWEEMAPHGYQSGISMALHLPHGRHVVFGVDGDRALPNQQKELTRMVADLASVLMYAQQSAFRLLPLPRPGDVDPHLHQAIAAELSPLSSGCLSEGHLLPPLKRNDFCTTLDRLAERDRLGRSILKARFHKPIH